VFTPGNVTFLERFPFIPDFLSVSRNARLQMSGTPSDLGHVSGDLLYDYFGFLYIYSLEERHWIADTDEFDEIMISNGFEQQAGRWHNDDTEYWMYFYHRGRNVSLTYSFSPDFDILLAAVSSGNVFDDFFNNFEAVPGVPPSNPAIVGTWHCSCGAEWFCDMVFSADGRFIDGDGDTGAYVIRGNNLELTFDFGMDSSLRFTLNADVLTIQNHRLNRVRG
jgi:hypothetical protein